VAKLKQVGEIIPPWNMPSDPVKAVLWFLHWLLKVLVRFFWIPVLGMTIFETWQNWTVGGSLNGILEGAITLLVGIGVWAFLYMILQILNISTRISRVIAEVNRLQQGSASQRPFYPFNSDEAEGRVVEGTITDLEEERKKRRRE
jgi:hypothetical protein